MPTATTPLNATEFDVLASAREQLHKAARGERGAIIDRVARTLGCSAQTAYRKLGQAGFDSQRKRRSDAGESVLAAEQLELVAGVLAASLNKKGQRMPVATALQMLHASGRLPQPVHESTVSRQLYQRHLHPEQLALPTACVQMASRHPNHVWQIDSTTGAYYYLPGGRLRWMPEDQFYKNKVANLVKASSDLLTRYAVADHTSHAFKCRYYLGGETAENLLDFATWAMVQQPGCPVHGVPFMLLLDPGAANKGQLMRNFCKRVGIRLEHHAPGAARVTGSVEKVHDLVRMHFETRFRFIDPALVTLDHLNAEIQAWTAAYCSTRVHSRHGRTRYAGWMEIAAEQLRVPHSQAVLLDAAVSDPVTPRVSNDRRIQFKGLTYSLAMVPGVVAGLKATVQANVVRWPAIDVQFVDQNTGVETWHVVEPEADNGSGWGFGAGAPVWGEVVRTAANSDVDDHRNGLLKAAYRDAAAPGTGLPTIEQAARARKAHAAAFAGVVDPMADVKATAVPAYLPRRGTPVGMADRHVEARLLNTVEACMRLRDLMGERYSPQVYAFVAERHAAGLAEDQLDGVAALFTAPEEPQAATGGGDATRLRAVGG